MNPINLSTLPPPQIVEIPDFEAIVADMKANLVRAIPELSAVLALESEPLVKAFEVFAYRELILRSRVNDAAKGVMLAYAQGADLDNLAAFYGVVRHIVQAADVTTIPPTAEILEDDESYRARIQLAPEGFSVAGPIGAYRFHAKSADPSVKDVGVSSPNAGQVLVTILSTQFDGAADDALLDSVLSALNDEDVRPLTDHVIAQSAHIIHYEVEAKITLYEGPDSALVKDEAQRAVEKYVDDNHRLGHDITISGLHAALHQAGVQNVKLISPKDTIIAGANSAAHCTNINIVVGGRDA